MTVVVLVLFDPWLLARVLIPFSIDYYQFDILASFHTHTQYETHSNCSLYRKYKREAITRKILEVEAQLQSTMELEAELDNPAHRPDRRQYESSSSSESDDSYDRKRRKRRKDRKSKSGKKVRAKSRNNKQDPEYEKAKHKMELMELEAQAKVEEVKHATIEKKENHRRHHPDSGFNSHQNQTTELFNDKPPTYSR